MRELLRDIGITKPWEQDGGPKWKRDALAGGSKSKTGKGEGKPEFVFVIDDFIVIIEDKKETRFTRCIKKERITTEFPYRQDYALNGAVHYAEAMIRNGIPYTKGIFAVGIGGDERHHEISVSFIGQGITKQLDDLDNLDVFSEDAVGEYHSVAVLGNKPQAEVRLDSVKAAASLLHEGMRNYGSVENDRKAPLVSAILLALEKPGFNIDDLKGVYDQDLPDDWDGAKIYKAAHDYMRSKGFGPQQKIGTLLDQFAFIEKSPTLNRVHSELGVTPLKWCAQILKSSVQNVVTDPSMSSFDVLGNFYHEFISYGGGDGNTLGIVLTPEHVTTLMADLIEIGAGDWVLDPTAGTASFLIAAMHQMFKDAGGNEAVKEDIRKNRLHGIELQDKLFAIGTTNMILRGDGKANFRRDSIFEAPLHEMRGDKEVKKGEWELGHGFTKVLLNPPYSQAKDKTTRHLSEVAFIEKALKFLNPGGRLAAIVPQQTMVGKTKEDTSRKASIMKSHTLDAVITMNPATFADSGVTPHTVIALFTAGRPHPKDAKVKFVNFANDGRKVQIHRGLTDDGTAASRCKHLLEVLRGDTNDDTRFIVRSEVTAKDEWLHSYFYFNDQPPSQDDFMATVADYLTWQVDMHSHGYGDLLKPTKAGHSDKNDGEKSELFDDELPILDFEPMLINEMFESMKASAAWCDKVSLKSGTGRNLYLSQTHSSNSVSEIVADQGIVPESGNCITMTLKTQAIFYQPSPFYTAQNFLILRHPSLDANSGMILVTALRRAADKFSWGYGISMERMSKTRIMVPVKKGCGTQTVDWEGMRQYGKALRAKAEHTLIAFLDTLRKH